MTDLTPFQGVPIHCEMCGQETRDHLFGTFGVMCAACVEQTSGHTLAELAAIDPATVPQRILTADEQEAIIQATMARYGLHTEHRRWIERTSQHRGYGGASMVGGKGLFPTLPKKEGDI